MSERNINPTIMVIFGATGDLTSRKLLPALYNLSHDGFLPDKFAVVGASRTPLSDDDFRGKILTAAKEHSRNSIKEEVWEKFSKSLFYQKLDGLVQEDFLDLAKRIKQIEDSFGSQCNVVYYLATSPSFFAPIARNLSLSNLI